MYPQSYLLTIPIAINLIMWSLVLIHLSVWEVLIWCNTPLFSQCRNFKIIYVPNSGALSSEVLLGQDRTTLSEFVYVLWVNL